MKKLNKIFFLVFIFTCYNNFAQKTSKYLDSLLKSDLPQHANVLANPVKYKLQVIYTRITRDKNNKPSFKNYYWRVDTNKYFYPASLVKLPVSIAAIEKLNELKSNGIDRNTPMITDSVFFCEKRVTRDSSSENKMPSIAHYIKKMFLISDNYSFARVYEFLGCDYAHQKFEKWGFPDIRIVNRLDVQCKGDTGKITSPVYFVSPNGDALYKQPLTYSSYNKSYPLAEARAGKAYINDAGKRVYQPKDFSKHNLMNLANCHEIFKRLVFYHYLDEKLKYNMTEDDWQFMMKYLGMYPRESQYPAYDSKTFYDSFKKYFVYASAVPEITQDSLRVFNIVGRAYGFLSDCAYIVDYKNNIEFLVSATIFVNEKQVIGNGKYEYDQIGLPLFKDISLLLYKTEKQRKKKHEPDLKEFDFFTK